MPTKYKAPGTMPNSLKQKIISKTKQSPFTTQKTNKAWLPGERPPRSLPKEDSSALLREHPRSEHLCDLVKTTAQWQGKAEQNLKALLIATPPHMEGGTPWSYHN